MDRRGFFQRALAALGALLGAGLLLPARALAARKLAFGLDKAEGLRKVGGQALLKLQERELLFIRASESAVLALDPICTHEKCKVAYDPALQKVVCPCHKSSFDPRSGKPETGPAPRKLATFPAELQGERVVVTLE